MHNNNPVTLKPCCYVLYFFKYAYSSIPLKNQNLHNKDPERLAFNIFCLSGFWLSSSLYTLLKRSKTTSPQNCSVLIASQCMNTWNKVLTFDGAFRVFA